MRLTNACKNKGITILITNQTAGFMNQEEISGIGISSIIDTILILRLATEESGLQRKLLVVKSRGSGHSNRYHKLSITDGGIEVAGD
ncbi:MAG: hypothetical protein IPK39_13435 [Sulfuritalea sp.]|nr:hypothetical protein [Sulfuritalea sp.]